jgi:hypothetical protein
MMHGTHNVKKLFNLHFRLSFVVIKTKKISTTITLIQPKFEKNFSSMNLCVCVRACARA